MNDNLFFLVILFIVPVLIVIMVIKKKKNKSGAVKKISKQDRDEVWKTVKQFLRNNNEIGKEVFETYVVKRPDPFDVSKMTPNQKEEYKKKQLELKNLKRTDPNSYKKEISKIKNLKKHIPECYLIWFISRNSKTGNVDDPRIIECNILYKNTGKKSRERTIVIKGLADFNKEMEWIKPIKDKDDKQYQKRLKHQQEVEARKEARKIKLSAIKTKKESNNDKK